MKAIYKFLWPSDYSLIEGTFCADKKYVEENLGKEIYLGEVNGKHSEVYGTIDKDDLKILTDDLNAVDYFEKYKLNCGYNPFNYIENNN